jgi:hypothetical protein
MESDDRNDSQEHSSLTQGEKYLTASYAAMMAEMVREDEYDFEDNEEAISDEEAEILFN